MNEEANSYRLPLIGDKAPEFTALTTQEPLIFRKILKENGFCSFLIHRTLHRCVQQSL